MKRIIALSLAGFLAAPAALAQDGATSGAPMSAIDWLSDSVTKPDHSATPPPPQAPADIGDITMRPLDLPRLDSVGLVSAAGSNLPETLWNGSEATEIERLIGTLSPSTLPSMQRLSLRLLLAELDPPDDIGGDGDGALLLARLDKLLAFGALEQAQALVERAGPDNADLFRRWFDISLLTGHEDRACALMRDTPQIAPTYPARIFCLARTKDWQGAALTLETGQALNQFSADDLALLERFLELDLDENAALPPPPPRPSPLMFRIYEAVGERLSTAGLPLAFAHSDLSFGTGWKAKIEATERLVASGAMPPARLLAIYSERSPAASGGLWERVGAVQNLDVALLAGDDDAIAAILPLVWRQMGAAGLQSAFARLYGERLARRPLPAPAAALALRIALVSDRAPEVARAFKGEAPDGLALALAIARGDRLSPAATPASVAPGGNAGLDAAIRAAFAPGAPALQGRAAHMLQAGRSGETLLLAMSLIRRGARGDLADLTAGLTLLRKIGQEDSARQAALEALLLDPKP